MTEFIPIEIVLKIVSEYFQEITTKTFSCQTWTGDIFSYNMKIKKFLPKEIEENVRAAKNFRLVCTDVARSYDPCFIERNIGGSLFRKQYITLLRLNGQLSTPYLKPLHARVLLGKYFDQGYFYNITKYARKKVFDVKDYYEVVTRDPSLILDNDFMNQLTQNNQIIEPIRLGFDYRALYPSLFMTKKRYIYAPEDVPREDPLNDPEVQAYAMRMLVAWLANY